MYTCRLQKQIPGQLDGIDTKDRNTLILHLSFSCFHFKAVSLRPETSYNANQFTLYRQNGR